MKGSPFFESDFIREYTSMDLYSAALRAAKEANFVVKSVTNRMDAQSRVASDIRQRNADLLASLRLNKPNPKQADILQVAAYARQYGIGNCGELAAVAYKHLLDHGVRPLDYMNLTNGSDHSFVILGRPANKMPLECGDEVIVCDPWYVWHPVYPITEMSTYMANWLKPGAGLFGCARVER